MIASQHGRPLLLLDVDGPLIPFRALVVKVEDGEVSAWSNDFAHGVRSLVVDDRRVGMVGGCRPNRDRLVIGELGESALRDAGRTGWCSPTGSPCPTMYAWWDAARTCTSFTAPTGTS